MVFLSRWLLSLPMLLFMMLKNGAGGDFRGAFAIATRGLGALKNVLMHSLLLPADPFHMFFNWHVAHHFLNSI